MTNLPPESDEINPPVVDLEEKLRAVQQRIALAAERSSRTSDSVELIAVSKYRPMEQLLVQYQLGQRHFAENRVQESQRKIPEFPSGCTWHLIGPLQTNKAKYLPGLIDFIHSVEREKVVNALESAYAQAGKTVKVLVQVNIAEEEQKSGCEPDEVEHLIQFCQASPSLRVEGLMTMAPYCDDPEKARPIFRALRELAEAVRKNTGLALPHLSMGMSGDFEVAVEEGSTLVRIGSALYE